MNNKIEEIEEIVKKVDEKFPREAIWARDELKSFLRGELTTFEKEIRKKTVKEVVELSDRIELGQGTTFEEWKAFKHFRNTMRDSLSPKEKSYTRWPNSHPGECVCEECNQARRYFDSLSPKQK